MQQAQKQLHSNTTESAVSMRSFIESLLATQGSYLSDSLYSLKLNHTAISLTPSEPNNKNSLRWLVLGREHYFETTKEYPIANKRDLLQALKFDDDKAPFSGITLQYIERINEQSHRVTFWVIKPQVIDGLTKRPWLIIPESFLFAYAQSKNTILSSLTFANKTLYIAKTGKGLSSGLQSPQIPNIESFAFSTGSPINNDASYVIANAEDIPSLLYKGLSSLSFNQIKGLFLETKKISWHNYPWRKAALLSGIVLSSYLVLTSGWLMLKQFNLEQQLAQQMPRVNQALAQQKQYKKQVQLQQQLIQPLQGQEPSWNVWHIVAESVTAGATISALHFKNDKITLDVATRNPVLATDILAKISENPYIKRPSFSKPVRKRKGKEEFSISFGFSHLPANNLASNITSENDSPKNNQNTKQKEIAKSDNSQALVKGDDDARAK